MLVAIYGALDVTVTFMNAYFYFENVFFRIFDYPEISYPVKVMWLKKCNTPNPNPVQPLILQYKLGRQLLSAHWLHATVLPQQADRWSSARLTAVLQQRVYLSKQTVTLQTYLSASLDQNIQLRLTVAHAKRRFLTYN